MTTPLQVPAPTARRLSYFASSRAPRYSLLFALPLLAGYEVLGAVLGQSGAAQLRNGADVLLATLATAVLGSTGPIILMLAVIVLALWMVGRDLRRSRAPLRPAVFLGMIAESVALALVFGIVVGTATAKVVGPLRALMLSPLDGTTWPTRLMLSLGAGLFEELLFRVLLVTALAAAARIILGFGRRSAGAFATIAGALVFSAFHYVGPYGDPLQLQSFVFRMISGIAFSGLYLLRGFGITAWTHALYDSFLLLL